MLTVHSTLRMTSIVCCEAGFKVEEIPISWTVNNWLMALRDLLSWGISVTVLFFLSIQFMGFRPNPNLFVMPFVCVIAMGKFTQSCTMGQFTQACTSRKYSAFDELQLNGWMPLKSLEFELWKFCLVNVGCFFAHSNNYLMLLSSSEKQMCMCKLSLGMTVGINGRGYCSSFWWLKVLLATPRMIWYLCISIALISCPVSDIGCLQHPTFMVNLIKLLSP